MKVAKTRLKLIVPNGKPEKKSRNKPIKTIHRQVFPKVLKIIRSRNRTKTRLGLAPQKSKKGTAAISSTATKRRNKRVKKVFILPYNKNLY